MIQHLSTQENLNLFVELSELEMAATTGGAISATFLNRLRAKAIAGNPNISRISQRLVNEFHKGGLTAASASSWVATVPISDMIAIQKGIVPLVRNYLASGGAIAGATPSTVLAIDTYLSLVSIPNIPIL
jgi:hypothetical protein